MKPLKTKVSITLDTDLIEHLKILAEADDRSFSQYINLILKDFLSRKCHEPGINDCPDNEKAKNASLARFLICRATKCRIGRGDLPIRHFRYIPVVHLTRRPPQWGVSGI